MDKNTRILWDMGLTFTVRDEGFGIFASDRNKMIKRFQLIKEKYPKATAKISLNSCNGDFIVDLSTENKYPLTEINKETLFKEYKKEIKNACLIDNEMDMVNQIEKIHYAYKSYLR